MIDPNLPKELEDANLHFAVGIDAFIDLAPKVADILPKLDRLAQRKVGPGDEDQRLANVAINFAALTVRMWATAVRRELLDMAAKHAVGK